VEQKKTSNTCCGTVQRTTNASCCSSAANNSQIAKRQLVIEFLYLDLSICTRCQGAGDSLQEAIDEVAHVLAQTGVEVVVRKIHVETAEQALALGFVSSPTIRINGRDIQLDVKETLCESCGDLCGDEVDCRVWVYQGREYTEPPKGMIIEAILREVYGGGSQTAGTVEPLKQLPDNLKKFFAAKQRKKELGL